MWNTRKIVILFVLALYNTSLIAAPKCAEITKRILGKGLSVSKAVALHTSKALIYPAVGVPKLAMAGVHGIKEKSPKTVWERAGKIVKDDIFHILAYGGLYAIQQRTGMTVSQYEALTGTLDRDEERDKDGVIVIIDGFSDNDIYGGAGTYLYEAKFKDDPKAFLVRGTTMGHIESELNRIASEQGPIKRVELFTHGLPRYLQLIDHSYTTDYDEFMKTDVAKNTFAPNATVRFHACFVGNGPNGEHIGRTIAQNWLQHGGEVILSKVQMIPNIVEMVSMKANLPEPPYAVRRIGDTLSVATVLGTAPILFAEVQPEEQLFLLPSDKTRIFYSPKSGKERDDLTQLSKELKENVDLSDIHNIVDKIVPGNTADTLTKWENPFIDSWSWDIGRQKDIPVVEFRFSTPEIATLAERELQLDGYFSVEREGSKLRLHGKAERPKLERQAFFDRRDKVTTYLKGWRARIEVEDLTPKARAEKLRDVDIAQEHFQSFFRHFEPYSWLSD